MGSTSLKTRTKRQGREGPSSPNRSQRPGEGKQANPANRYHGARELSPRMSGQGLGSFSSQDLSFSELLLQTKAQEEVDETTLEPATQD